MLLYSEAMAPRRKGGSRKCSPSAGHHAAASASSGGKHPTRGGNQHSTATAVEPAKKRRVDSAAGSSTGGGSQHSTAIPVHRNRRNAPWSSAAVIWQYRLDSGLWADMSHDTSARLEEVYAAHHHYLTLHDGDDDSWDYDFTDMSQRRYRGTRPGTLRDIRRKLVKASRSS